MSQPIPRLDPVTGGPMHNWRDAPTSVEWARSISEHMGIEDIHKS
jgi:hypothetical protein